MKISELDSIMNKHIAVYRYNYDIVFDHGELCRFISPEHKGLCKVDSEHIEIDDQNKRMIFHLDCARK